MLSLKIAGWVANSIDPDENPHSAASHLDLHCLLRPVCPNIYGKYGIQIYLKSAIQNCSRWHFSFFFLWKWGLTVHVNHMPSWQFTQNVKPYFLRKWYYFRECHLLNLEYSKCPILSNTLYHTFVCQNTWWKGKQCRPDQTAPLRAVWSGSTLFAYAIFSDKLVFKILGHLQ